MWWSRYHRARGYGRWHAKRPIASPSALGEIAQRVGSVVPYNLYPPKEKKDILIAASAQALYHKLTRVDRAANQQELDRIIAAPRAR